MKGSSFCIVSPLDVLRSSTLVFDDLLGEIGDNGLRIFGESLFERRFANRKTSGI